MSLDRSCPCAAFQPLEINVDVSNHAPVFELVEAPNHYRCGVCGTLWDQIWAVAMHVDVVTLARTVLDEAGRPLSIDCNLALKTVWVGNHSESVEAFLARFTSDSAG